MMFESGTQDHHRQPLGNPAVPDQPSHMYQEAFARRRSRHWRIDLLGGVAAGALCVTPALAGPDACTVVGTIAVCSGNQSGGIDAGVDFAVPPINGLVIQNLTGDIGADPVTGDGVRWALPGSNVPINIVSNTGSFAIRASEHGFNLFNSAGASITLTHAGNIEVGQGSGIYVQANQQNGDSGSISIKAVGSIVAGVDGISAWSVVNSGNGNSGAVNITFDGTIVAGDGDGIYAGSWVINGNGNSGPATINTTGSITSINASSLVSGNGDSGDVSVTQNGVITAGGIVAYSFVSGNGNAGSVLIDNAGNVAGRLYAGSIVVGFGNASAVSITNSGNVVIADPASDDYAIEADSHASNAGYSGSVTIASTGNIGGGAGGIYARTWANGTGDTGDIVIGSTGDIASKQGIAALAFATLGHAGNVFITSTGNITAAIASGTSFAINAASISDGSSGGVTIESSGNLVSTAADGIVALSQSKQANSSIVSVKSTGNIDALDYGIRAMSQAEASAGSVTIISKGNIRAGKAAIVAESSGGSGDGDINIEVDGNLHGGQHGVIFLGGITNSLKIARGSVVLGETGYAIAGSTGDETIENAGTVIGNVGLGSGVNNFYNLNGATYISGTIINLGAVGRFENSGLFSIGKIGAAPQTAQLTGSFVQNADGVFVVDTARGTADRLNISGSAELAGKVLPKFGGMGGATQHYTILSADGGITNNGMTVSGNTLVVKYDLLFPNANDMVLAVTADFVTAGLTPNQRATATHLQNSLVAGGGGLGSVFGYLGGMVDAGSYAKALDRLHPEPYLAQSQSVLLSSLAFADGVWNCSDFGGAGVVRRGDGTCGWARMGSSRTTRNRTVENIGFDNTAWSGSAGMQFGLAPNWLVGVSVGYERSNITVDDRARSHGDLFQFGAGALYRQYGWELSGTLSAGVGSFDTTRLSVLPGTNATGSNSNSYLSGRLRTAYAFGIDAAYLKPMVDVDLTALRRGGIVENGAGAAGQSVRSQTDAILSVAPAVEIGGQIQINQDMALRPYVRGGVRLFDKSDLTATASFLGSPPDASPFTVSAPLDRTVGEVAAGVDLWQGAGLQMGVRYEGRLGASTQRHTGAFTLRSNF